VNADTLFRSADQKPPKYYSKIEKYAKKLSQSDLTHNSTAPKILERGNSAPLIPTTREKIMSYVPMSQRIAAMKTPAKEMMQGLYDDLADALFFPNSILPESLHADKEYVIGMTGHNIEITGKQGETENVIGRAYGRSGTSLLKKGEKIQEQVTRIDHREEQARRAELYAKQMEFCEKITYEPQIECDGALDKLASKFA